MGDQLTRDHFLALTIGLLAGFIAGYLLHDFDGAAPAGADPGRRGHGAGPAAVPARARRRPAVAAPPALAAQAPMAEIQRLRDHVERNPDDADAVLLLANLNFDIRTGTGRASSTSATSPCARAIPTC